MIKIAFIGKQQSGKTTALEFMKKKIRLMCNDNKHSVRQIKMAKPLYDMQNAIHSPLGIEKKNRVFLQDASRFVKNIYGEEIFLDIFKRTVQAYDAFNTHVLCDDIRFPFEFDYVSLNGWVTVFVDTPEDIRKERSDANGFEYREHESESFIDELGPKCEFTILNDTSEEDYLKSLEVLLKVIYEMKGYRYADV